VRRGGFAVDINTYEVDKTILAKLQEAFGDFKEVPAPGPAGGVGANSTWYAPGDKARAPFERMMVTTMHDVEIRNVKDRNVLDVSNSFVTMVMPTNTLPLPIYACDVDVHKGKYVHVIQDLIPLSKDPAYLKKYSEPLAEARKKYESLPGMAVVVPDELYKVFPAIKQFETFTSSGRVIGNIPVEHGSEIVNLITEYVNLYCSFVEGSASCPILAREEIQKEAGEKKMAFQKMMAGLDFSDDMPNVPRR
jgi:hypothetical protein